MFLSIAKGITLFIVVVLSISYIGELIRYESLSKELEEVRCINSLYRDGMSIEEIKSMQEECGV